LIKKADARIVEEVKWKKPSNPTGVPVWSHDGIVWRDWPPLGRRLTSYEFVRPSAPPGYGDSRRLTFRGPR